MRSSSRRDFPGPRGAGGRLNVRALFRHGIGATVSSRHPYQFVRYKALLCSAFLGASVVPAARLPREEVFARLYDFTVDEGGSAEPTRDKNITGMYRRRGSSPPSYVTPVGSSG